MTSNENEKVNNVVVISEKPEILNFLEKALRTVEKVSGIATKTLGALTAAAVVCPVDGPFGDIVLGAGTAITGAVNKLAALGADGLSAINTGDGLINKLEKIDTPELSRKITSITEDIRKVREIRSNYSNSNQNLSNYGLSNHNPVELTETSARRL